MRSLIIGSLALTGLLSSAYAPSGLSGSEYPEYASPSDIPSTTFALGQRIYGIRMSPNGQYAVAFYPAGDRFQLRLLSIGETTSSDVNKALVRAADLQRVVWIDNDSVVIERSRSFFSFVSLRLQSSHLVSSFSRTSDKMTDVVSIAHLTPESYPMNSIVHALPEEEGRFLLSYSPDGKSYPGVYKMDIRTGESETVVPPMAPFQGWWADAKGTVRLGLGMARGEVKMIVRTTESEEWQELANDQLVATGRVEPVSVEAGGKTMIVKSAMNQGRYGLYRISLETGKMLQKLFEHPVVDVQSITVSGLDQRLLSAEFITDRLEHHYFDKQYGSLLEAIGRALPDRSIRVLQTSRNDRFMLIFAGNEIYPGAYYRFDSQTGEFLLLDEVRTDINPAQMSPAARKNYFARDGLEIDGYLTVPLGSTDGGFPTVIMPHANPAGRDFMTFDYFVQFLASRGFAVFQPNYRGSSGYGYAFGSLAFNGWGMEMQDDLTDAATFLIDEGLSDPDRICISGRNYAGYAALLAVIRDPDIFACAIAISPVTNLPEWVKLVQRNFGKEAARAISGGRSKRKLKKSSPLHLAKELTRPALIVHGTADGVIPFDQSLQLVKKLDGHDSPLSSMALPGGDNNLSDVRFRARVFERMEAFLKQQIGTEGDGVFEVAE